MSYTILGLGISGLATLSYLIRHGAYPIFVSETRPYEDLSIEVKALVSSLKGSIEFEFGRPHSSRCLAQAAMLVSPGMPLDSPILVSAHQLGIETITEIDLGLRLESDCIHKLVAITGTNGKSTTTALTAHLMGVPPCGNIGTPLTRILHDPPPAGLEVVCEISSFQLAHSPGIHPQVALITNITPDHIGWHGSWEAYRDAKASIAKLQTSSDWLILPEELELPNLNQASQKVRIFSELEDEPLSENCAWHDPDQNLWLKIAGNKHLLIGRNESILVGAHNTANLLFASAAAYLGGVSLGLIRERLKSFQGLAHRLELVGEYGGKLFYNDSKATNPESTIVALRAFSEPITWIAGGRDKYTDLLDLMQVVKAKVSEVILYGEARERFKEALIRAGYSGEYRCVDTLSDALGNPMQNRVIVFSPACASFDQFTNFEQRGETFRKLVTEKYS